MAKMGYPEYLNKDKLTFTNKFFASCSNAIDITKEVILIDSLGTSKK